ncbi:MAG TPA: CPBP family intramembrane glutamic endopeptidase [Acidimicrobiales bacterium]|jgi:membrane protease YdiL (CAAX protease family)
MHVVAAILASLLVAYLVVVQPPRGVWGYRRLVRALPDHPELRLRYYVRSVRRQWIGVALVGCVGLLSGMGPRTIGLLTSSRFRFDQGLAVYDIVLILIGAPLGIVLLRRAQAKGGRRMSRPLRGAVWLLPTSQTERRTFVAVALTAGICEEIGYRGFLMSYFLWAFPHAGTALDVVLAAVVFGLGHAYQGTVGIAGTAFMGLVLGSLYVGAGTLLVPILWHVLVDLRLLLVPDTIIDQLRAETLAPPPPDRGQWPPTAGSGAA